MKSKSHFFCMEEQWNVAYLPYRPNGFAIFLLAEHERAVEKEASIWQQHPERKYFVESFVTSGYLVFTSELFGRHWGSQRSCDYAEKLYHFIMKNYILNKRIHFFVEGMGALVALQLMNKRADIFRSAFFLNPCIDLEAYYEQEKQNKLYYKRFKSEFSRAHEMKEMQLEKVKWFKPFLNESARKLPIRLYHHLQEKRYPLSEHSRPFEQSRSKANQPVSLHLYGSGKTFSSFFQPAQFFFKTHEKQL